MTHGIKQLFLMSFFLVSMMAQGCKQPIKTNEIDIIQALSTPVDKACYQAATLPAALEFPRDHGPHDGFQTEWWYYTGNLKTGQGRQFGYQLTFFRQALACEADSQTPVNASRWRTRQLYFAHFAVTDTQAGRFYADSRMNRQSLGIAGSQAVPFRVWVDNWSANRSGDKVVLTAENKDMRLVLGLVPERPVVLQGDHGLSRKGGELTAASYYYSLPRLGTKGSLTIGSQTHEVTGNSWFDHEWSTTALGRDVTGWDWFSVHLDNGQDLMVCQIRDAQGRPNGYGFGSLSLPDGTYEILGPDGFFITPTAHWKSPSTGKRYPGKWEISLPGKGLAMTVTPVIPNQEHTHRAVYWEGAVSVAGSKGNEKITGAGYGELTGY